MSKSIWHDYDDEPQNVCVGDSIIVVMRSPAFMLKTISMSEVGWVCSNNKPFDFVDCLRWAYTRDVIMQAIGGSR
jgi:hypothetical protein